MALVKRSEPPGPERTGCLVLDSPSAIKTVRPSGTSGRVYVPKAWVGRRVLVLLLGKE